MIISFDTIKNHVALSIGDKLVQIYPIGNSTFTIKRVEDERVGNGNQWRAYMHILGIDSSYYSHVGIDLYSTGSNGVTQILVQGQDRTDDLEGFINDLSEILG
jgi:hypothetical protein